MRLVGRGRRSESHEQERAGWLAVLERKLIDLQEPVGAGGRVNRASSRFSDLRKTATVLSMKNNRSHNAHENHSLTFLINSLLEPQYKAQLLHCSSTPPFRPAPD